MENRYEGLINCRVQSVSDPLETGRIIAIARCTGACAGCLTSGHSLKIAFDTSDGYFATNPIQFKCLKWGVELLGATDLYRVKLMGEINEGKAK